MIEKIFGNAKETYIDFYLIIFDDAVKMSNVDFF